MYNKILKLHMIFQQHLREVTNALSGQEGMTRQSERTKIIMAQYTNSTPNSNDWNFYFRPFPYSEGLIVLLILLYGLKIQLQNLITGEM